MSPMKTLKGDLRSLLPGEDLSRRALIQGFAAVLGLAKFAGRTRAAQGAPSPSSEATGSEPYSSTELPPTIGSRFINNGNGIRMHVLEAGFETSSRRPVVLLHGFPELAYSWRKVMPSLASAGFHVLAPHLWGYGRTSGWDVNYDEDLTPFRTLNEVRDILGLVWAFGYRDVAAVVGHYFGSPLAAWCSVVRPDVFRSVVLMIAPFAGLPALPFNTADAPESQGTANAAHDRIYEHLAALVPARKYYQRYYATRG